MSKIYLPTEYINMPCYQINNGYIRAFKTTNNNSYNVVYDIYVNQNYQVKQTSANFSSSTVCDSLNVYTDSVYYRNDFDKILVIFFILLIICFYFPYRIISRIFGRWLKW